MFLSKKFILFNIFFKIFDQNLLSYSSYFNNKSFPLIFTDVLSKDNIIFFRQQNWFLSFNDNLFSVFLYRFQLFNSFIGYLNFIYNYSYNLSYIGKFHLIGLTFGMGSTQVNCNGNRTFGLTVRMNQSHYSLFRLSTSFKSCRVEKHGWILKFSTNSLNDFYTLVYHLHFLRSLFPYKIKGFLFFSELEYQERNVFSGKQEKKSSSSEKDKGKGGAKRKSSDKDLKSKRGRKV